MRGDRQFADGAHARPAGARGPPCLPGIASTTGYRGAWLFWSFLGLVRHNVHVGQGRQGCCHRCTHQSPPLLPPPPSTRGAAAAAVHVNRRELQRGPRRAAQAGAVAGAGWRGGSSRGWHHPLLG